MNKIIEERRRVNDEDERYREAARRLTGGTVAPLESVNRPASNEGAFVSVTIFVPAAEVVAPTEP